MALGHTASASRRHPPRSTRLPCTTLSRSFQVQDDGGTLNGGIDLDATPNTITVNVTPVNDPSGGTAKAVTTLETTAYPFVADHSAFTHTIDSPANAPPTATITTLPSAASL